MIPNFTGVLPEPLIPIIADYIGTGVLLIYALASLFVPKRVAAALAQTFDNPRESAEFRIVNGGFFLGMAIFALIANQPLVYSIVGFGWIGAAATRLLSLLLDRPKVNASFFAFLALETTLGVTMIL